MKLQLRPLLCACALGLALSLLNSGISGAEGPAAGEKRQQAPVKRVRSAQPSIEPVTDAAKKLARSLQGRIGPGLTKQKLLALNNPKNKKSALGKGARFAINDAKADGKSPVGGRVLTSSGDLYVTYLPTAKGVIGVIEASTRLPTNSKADKTQRAELNVVGFRLNKVVEFYQFAFWPKRPSETLAAVVSRPPEFVSNGISPEQAAKLLSSPKKNAKSMPDEGKFGGMALDLAFKCGTGVNPTEPSLPGAGGGSPGRTCNSSKEEIANCKGYVLCACPPPGVSGPQFGCCCQQVTTPSEPSQPPSEVNIPQPILQPGSGDNDRNKNKEGPSNPEAPDSPGPQQDEPRDTIPKSPESPGPDSDENRIALPESPQSPGPDSDENRIALPDSPESPGPDADENRIALPESPQSPGPDADDIRIALPESPQSPGPSPENTGTPLSNPASSQDERQPERTDEEKIDAIVDNFMDDYVDEYGACPPADAVETLEVALSDYDPDEAMSCFGASDAEEQTDGDQQADGDQQDDQPAPPESKKSEGAVCPKSPVVQGLLQQARDNLPTTSDELLQAECEGARKALDAKIERQRDMLNGTKARLALVRKDIADLESNSISFFIGHRRGTFDLMKHNEAIEIETLAKQQNLLSTLENAQKPVDCSPEALRRVVTDTDKQRTIEEQAQREQDQALLANLYENIGQLDDMKYQLEFLDQVNKTTAFFAGGPAFTGVLVLAQNALEAGGNVYQGNKDLSSASADASRKAANDLFNLALLKGGLTVGGLAGNNIPLPATLRLAWLARAAIAGGTAGVTIGSGQAGKSYLTGEMSGEQAAHTVGMSVPLGIASGMLSSNNLARDLLGQVLVSSLSTVATGDPSSKKFYQELFQNTITSFVANRAAKCGIKPRPEKSKPSDSSPNRPADPPMRDLSPQENHKEWLNDMADTIKKFPEELQPSLKDFIEKQPDTIIKPGETVLLREGERLYRAPDGSFIKIKVFIDQFGQVYGISDAVSLGKPANSGNDADAVPTDFGRDLKSSLPERQSPPDKETLTKQGLEAFRRSKDPASDAEKLKKGEEALNRWLDLKMQEAPKNPSGITEQLPTQIKDLEQQSAAIKRNPDGSYLSVEYIADKNTGKPVAITNVKNVDPNSPNGGTPGRRVNDYADPLATKDPNSDPLTTLGGRTLSLEALEQRKFWLDNMRQQINETAPLSAQKAMAEWVQGKSLNENTNWGRTAEDAILVEGAPKERIKNSQGTVYEITYTVDVLSKYDGDKPGGKVFEILKVDLIPSQPKRQKASISDQRYYNHFMHQFQMHEEGLRNWAKNEKNCPADAEVAFLDWARMDMRKRVDWQALPSSFPWQKVEKVQFMGRNDAKYEAEIARDDRTGLIQPLKVTEIEPASASRQARSDWIYVHKGQIFAGLDPQDGSAPNIKVAQEKLRSLGRENILSEARVNELVELANQTPSHGSSNYHDFLDMFEAKLNEARNEMLSRSPENSQ